MGVVVAEPVVQQRPLRSLHSKEPGAGSRATRVCHQKLNGRNMLLLAVLGHGDKAMVLRAVVVAVARAQAWHLQLLQRGPHPAFEAAATVPPGVWPAPGVGFEPLGAAPGGVVVACFACAVHGGSRWRSGHGLLWWSS